MSDAPAPMPASQQPSVVIDTNAKVSMPRWHIVTALAVVAALVAFTVVWFVTNDDGDYTPGPWSQALLDAGAAQGAQFDFPDDELKCIDETGERTGVAVDFFAEGADPLDAVDPFTEPNEAEVEFFGTMLDDCLSRDSRVQLISRSMMADSGENAMGVTEEQAECVGEAFDDTVMDAGGYRAMVEDPENAMSLMFGMFEALADCGLDMTEMMDV